MRKRNIFSPAIAIATSAICLLSTSLSGRAAENYFNNWPKGASPKVIGTNITERFLAHPGSKKEIRYQEVITWYGALTFAKVSGQPRLTKALIERAAPLLKEEASVIPPPNHVDRNVFGALAAEIYLQSGNKQFYELAKRFADIQWEPTEEIRKKGDEEDGKPQGGLSWRLDEEAKRNMQQGLSWQTRYWIDDMYMITMAQRQMFLASNDRKYIDRAAKEMVAYLDKLQEPNGLFHHAPDVPFFWGRGNGWMAAGMTELLRFLPKDNPDRARILEGYRKMMATLKETQIESGMWRQLIDDPESWPETSGTGMFTFALVTGVKEGWLDPKVYGPVARKAWIALAGYMNDVGQVREVCTGTDKKNSREYYLERARVVGDLHGQAAVLWSATALLR